jgi:hypothetical protein
LIVKKGNEDEETMKRKEWRRVYTHTKPSSLGEENTLL